MQEKILILDFGSQYTQLIARRVRELNVYCEIHPYNHFPQPDESVRGVILSGSPYSVRDAQAPQADLSAIKGRFPMLGVCYGAQYLSQQFGGEVKPSATREYGRAILSKVVANNPLIAGLSDRTQVWMSHGDTIVKIPENYRIIASTDTVPVAAFQIEGEQTWGIQFHPEVYHSTEGKQLLKHFVVDICGCRQQWTPDSFIESTVRELRDKIKGDKVLLGLSGGVDSSVAAELLHKAVDDQLVCIFVDMGLLRKDEFESVLKSYESMGLNVIGVRAGDKFLADLAGVTDPEKKDYRPRFHRSIRRRGAETDRREVARPGNDLSRRDRIDLGQRPVGDDQIAPQRRGAARKDEPQNRRTAATAVQGRSTPRGTPVERSGGYPRAPSVPGAGTRHPYPRRSDGRESPYPARSR